ncbi:MAG: aspartate aminotransferase family protein [Methanomassiliicoccales archaeon]
MNAQEGKTALDTLPGWVPEWAKEAPKIIVTPPGPKSREIIKLDKEYISHAYDRVFTFTIERAAGAAVCDVDGNTYIDWTAGIAVMNAGWGHPAVVDAIKRQSELLIHSFANDTYFEKEAVLGKLLSDISPEGKLKGAFFCNSGAEAVGAAAKLTTYHTKKFEFISFFGAYHGRVGPGLNFTSKLKYRFGFGPLNNVLFAPYAYCYRCPFKMEYPSCDLYCMHFMEEQILNLGGGTGSLAGVIVEPVQGEGGYIVPPDRFMPFLRDFCDRHQAVLIADEVQSGLGRTGRMWASEWTSTIPDILVTGKAVGGGIPLGAIVAKPEIMKKWRPGAHSSTFGGNAVQMAAGIAHVKAIIEERLAERAEQMGNYLLERLSELQERHAIIGDVRGRGLMVGVEFVKDRTSREPLDITSLQTKCYRKGLLTLTAGIYGNVMRIAPPLIISREFIDKGLEIFEEAIRELEADLAAGTTAPAV